MFPLLVVLAYPKQTKPMHAPRQGFLRKNASPGPTISLFAEFVIHQIHQPCELTSYGRLRWQLDLAGSGEPVDVSSWMSRAQPRRPAGRS